MQSTGLSSDYAIYGMLLSAWLLILCTDHFTAQVETDHPPLYALPDLCPAAARGKLPPPDQLTLPIYPGCEDRADYEDRFYCGADRLSAFIKANKQDPAESRKEIVAIDVTIGRVSGKMAEVKVSGGIDVRNKREALRIINVLVERDVRWTPATRKGEPTCFRLRIGIPFHGAGCGK